MPVPSKVFSLIKHPTSSPKWERIEVRGFFFGCNKIPFILTFLPEGMLPFDKLRTGAIPMGEGT
jgi:hypothetical protein